jgi:hypothetical protein
MDGAEGRTGCHARGCDGFYPADHPVNFLRVEGVTRESQIDRPGRHGQRFFERAAYGHRDTAGVAYFPAILGDVLHGAHLRIAAAGAERVVITEGSVIAHGGGNHHRRAVEVGIEELARPLPGAGGKMHVHECRPPGCAGVGIGGRQHQRFVQQQDGLNARNREEGIEEARFRTAGVSERVVDALRHQLMHQQLATGAGDLLSAAHFSPPRRSRLTVSQNRGAGGKAERVFILGRFKAGPVY